MGSAPFCQVPDGGIKKTVTIKDILEIEQMKYCYEQAYALHRHTDIPGLFFRSEETSFAIAEDTVKGFDTIERKFREDLFYVSPREDSYHTGWQICTPLIGENPENGQVYGFFPTFGYLVISMDPKTMNPPYPVLSTGEMWRDLFVWDAGKWRISDLKAKFLIGQCVWTWNTSRDKGLAVQHALRNIPHPLLNPGDESANHALRRLAGNKEDENKWIRIPGSLLYGVQFAQSLYGLLWECGRMEEIPDRVFSQEAEISVCHEGKMCRGQKEVRCFYNDMKKQAMDHGGFLRNDMPATQYIEPGDDGTMAIGHYLVFTKRIQRTGNGNRFVTSIGRFTNGFVMEENIWKLKSVCFETVCEFEAFPEQPDQNLALCRENPQAWLEEIPELKSLCTAEASRPAEEILALRNEIFSWFHLWQEERMRAQNAPFVNRYFPCAEEEAWEAISGMMHKLRYMLITSPVLTMSEDCSEAEAFFSTSNLYEYEEGALVDTRGGIFMRLHNCDGEWQIREFGWYPYASLEPWNVV